MSIRRPYSVVFLVLLSSAASSWKAQEATPDPLARSTTRRRCSGAPDRRQWTSTRRDESISQATSANPRCRSRPMLRSRHMRAAATASSRSWRRTDACSMPATSVERSRSESGESMPTRQATSTSSGTRRLGLSDHSWSIRPDLRRGRNLLDERRPRWVRHAIRSERSARLLDISRRQGTTSSSAVAVTAPDGPTLPAPRTARIFRRPLAPRRERINSATMRFTHASSLPAPPSPTRRSSPERAARTRSLSRWTVPGPRTSPARPIRSDSPRSWRCSRHCVANPMRG